MRKWLPYRLIATALGLLLLAGVVFPVVQSACAAHMQQGADGSMHATHASPAAMSHGEAIAAVDHREAAAENHINLSHGASGVRSVDYSGPAHNESPPCEPTPDCHSCCIVEWSPSTWSTIRVVENAAGEGDVPPRYDVATLIAPVEDQPPARPDLHRPPPTSPVRVHVWTSTFLT
jgi:hypothetical protein